MNYEDTLVMDRADRGIRGHERSDKSDWREKITSF